MIGIGCDRVLQGCHMIKEASQIMDHCHVTDLLLKYPQVFRSLAMSFRILTSERKFPMNTRRSS